MTFLRSAGLCSATAVLFALSLPRLHADEAALPANMGRHLRQMVDWYQSEGAAQPANTRRTMLARRLPAQNRRAQIDATASSAVVNVMLDGTRPLPEVQASLEKLGAGVFAQNDTGGAGSVLSTHLPLASAVEASKVPGVHSLSLVRRPHRHVGKITSQGVGVIKSDQVNAMGYDGTGITVGVLSDSYNRVTPSAAADVLSGDLPGIGNPQGFTTPVQVLQDGAPADDGFNSDEGRAMLQIVHDVAPGAKLAFATTGDTPESFAANIRALRTAANCDVMVDDVTFNEEPFFSDGVIAQAIDDVVNSSTLAGKKIVYYTAAGNSSNGVYLGDFYPVSDDAVRGGQGIGNLRLDQVPDSLTAGGFHNFKHKPNKTIIVQRFTVKGSGQPVTDGSDIVEVDFQWDDPFIAGLITTDYNLLIFDENGNYRADLSGTDNNFSTGMPSEYADLGQSADGSDATYQIVISRTARGAGTATHLRTIAYTEANLYLTNKFTKPSTPSIYGHQAPPGGDGVAAYDYTHLAEPEDYSSLGPMTIYFDRNGNRLATPEVRLQPTLAAPDGVDTTFFPQGGGQDSDDDGFPNFFGTSAAAPHVAGVAALLLQAGGGPSSLTTARVRTLLESTAGPHDLDPSFSAATVQSADGLSTATLTANGDSSDNSVYTSNFFQLSFTGPPTRSIKKVIIDLSAANLEFDTSTGSGFPFIATATGPTLTTADVIAKFSGPTDHPNILTLKFPPNTFFPGNLLSFGVDRDTTETDSAGNSADVLAGATVSVRAVDEGGQAKGNGVFVNQIGTGQTAVDGFGLINAEAAIQLLLTGQ